LRSEIIAFKKDSAIPVDIASHTVKNAGRFVIYNPTFARY
jgi:hypothetical protein